MKIKQCNKDLEKAEKCGLGESMKHKNLLGIKNIYYEIKETKKYKLLCYSS